MLNVPVASPHRSLYKYDTQTSHQVTANRRLQSTWGAQKCVSLEQIAVWCGLSPRITCKRKKARGTGHFKHVHQTEAATHAMASCTPCVMCRPLLTLPESRCLAIPSSRRKKHRRKNIVNHRGAPVSQASSHKSEATAHITVSRHM